MSTETAPPIAPRPIAPRPKPFLAIKKHRVRRRGLLPEKEALPSAIRARTLLLLLPLLPFLLLLPFVLSP